jgi:rod shape-determining protein MreC
MKKTHYFAYLILIFFLLFVLSFSKNSSEKIRTLAVSSISPFWGKINNLRISIGTLLPSKNEKILKEKKQNFELENALLKDQIDSVYKWLTFDQRIDSQLEILKEVKKDHIDDLYWKDFFERRSEELKKILEVELQALPAKIIFREPSSWSSSVWINLGEKENDELGRLIIGINSPVVVGDSLVGVVEYVGKYQSRIRLITDSGLVPSVRAVRGKTQDRDLLQVTMELYERIHARKDLFESDTESVLFFDMISALISRLKSKNSDYFLAKGELHGSSYPLWRSYGQTIKGVGFNYDYSDEEGPERELKSGKSLDNAFDFLNQALLKEGDLLITTGMDGVFPAGLKVGFVTKVKKIEEGDYSYNIEALPTARDLSNLNIVFVMPPLNFQKNIDCD